MKRQSQKNHALVAMYRYEVHGPRKGQRRRTAMSTAERIIKICLMCGTSVTEEMCPACGFNLSEASVCRAKALAKKDRLGRIELRVNEPHRGKPGREAKIPQFLFVGVGSFGEAAIERLLNKAPENIVCVMIKDNSQIRLLRQQEDVDVVS
jgi:hypothetical protein